MSEKPADLMAHLASTRRVASGGYALPASVLDLPPVRAGGSRRRRLWEMPHRLHCPVIGVCFACDELRALMKKVMRFPADTSDYVLHTTAVGASERRGPAAELLHRTLEQRYRLVVKSLSSAKTTAALREAWQQACVEGSRVPAVLWACWTHPALDDALEQEIYGDIHMLQHQLGSGTRADLRALHAQREENARLKKQCEYAMAALDLCRSEKAAALQDSAREAAALRADLAAERASRERLAAELSELQADFPHLRDAQALMRRLASVEIQAEAARQRAASLEREVTRLREFARYAEETIEALGQDGQSLPEDLPERDLSGKRVLCVGGRSGSVGSYREVVEQSGGLFLHHDGGLEESLHRIDNVVAAADIVICQAGCISHNAYWRVKEHCKRTGKRCVFVKGAGVSSFDQAIDKAGRTDR